MKIELGFLAATFGASVLGDLGAQESAPQAKPEKPVIVRRFFDRPIDYWGQGFSFQEESKGSKKSERLPEARPAGGAQRSDWGQMVTLPDGTLSYRELPRPLVELLENPTPENIRAYFEFRMNRTQKILRAADLIRDYRTTVLGPSPEGIVPGLPPASLPLKVDAGSPPGPAAPVETRPGAKSTAFKLTYFHKKQCPHCDHQDQILAEWLKDKPEGKLEVIEFGTQPELWRAYQVRGTPTLLMEDPGTKQSAFMEGLTRVDELERKLGECRSRMLREGASKGEGPK